MRRASVLCLALGLGLGCASSVPPSPPPSAPLVLDAARGDVWLGPQVAVAADVAPEVTLEDVLAGAVAFHSDPRARPAYRFGAGVIWLRLTVDVSEAAARERWVLAFSHPRPRGVTLHWTDENGARHTSAAGLALPSSEHAVRARAVVVPLPLAHAGTHTFHVRLEAFPVGFSGVVTTLPRFQEREARESALLALYYGGVLALLAYNLVLSVSLRRRAYLLFAGLALCHVGFFLGRNGWLWRFDLWTMTSRNVGGLIPSVTVALLLGFTMDVLGTRATAPRLHRVGRWLVGAAALNAVLAAAGLGRFTDTSGALLGFVGVALALVIAVWQWRGEQPGAGEYLVGFGAYLAGALLYVAKLPGWIPHTALTEHGMQVGSAVNLVFSALALARQVKWLEVRQQRLADEQRRLTLEHEREVARLRAASLTASLREQANERERVARELHDGIGHLLLRVKQAARALPTGGEELQELAVEGMKSVHAISQALHPAALSALGLSRALVALAEQSVRHSEVGLSLSVMPIDDLVEEAAHPDAYRVVQQAIANALAHGRPRTLSVEASREGEQVLIAVTDDGVGCEPDGTSGAGLGNMRQRAARAGGALVFDSTPGEGTRVELWLPVRAPDDDTPR